MYLFLIDKFLIKKRVYRTSLHNLKKTTTVFRVVRSVTALVVDLCISKFLPGTANMGLAAELALLRRNVFLVRPLLLGDTPVTVYWTMLYNSCILLIYSFCDSSHIVTKRSILFEFRLRLHYYHRIKLCYGR